MLRRSTGWLAAFPLLLAFVSATLASDQTVLEKTHSTINGDLSVVDVSGARFMVAEANQGIQFHGTLDLQKHSRLLTPYTQIVSMLTAMDPTLDRAFDMGLGGGTLARFHLALYPKLWVDSVEIDSAVIDLATKYFFVKDSRHRIIEGDGFDTLSRLDQKYDVIWMDEFTPKEGPRAMVQAEYQKILRDHIKPDGLLIVHLGTGKTPKQFLRTISDYQNGFSHGIRIQGPAALSEPLAKLRLLALSLAKKHGGSPPYLPDQVVAFTNSGNLSCARFWQIYQHWLTENLIDLRWPDAERKQTCQELTP